MFFITPKIIVSGVLNNGLFRVRAVVVINFIVKHSNYYFVLNASMEFVISFLYVRL